MIKLISQLAGAFIIYYICRHFELGTVLTVFAILIGFGLVHLAWEHLVFNPYAYLGVMHIAEDDPIMNRAEQKAKETMSEFINDLFPKHKEDSMVKFIYKNANDEVEKIWADLLEVSDNELKVYVRTIPNHPKDDFDLKMNIAIDNCVDWSIEKHNGDLLGGFTNYAVIKIFERQEGYMHPKFKKHIGRFKSIGEGLG